jgi:tRNA dimethylallyltransferase
VAGGTGLYISALTEGYVLPKPQISKIKSQNLRKNLNKLNLKELLKKLKQIDPETFLVIDKNNRVRVQRALEIFYETGLTKSAQLKKQQPKYQFLILGLTLPKDQLKIKITKRLKQRLDKEGMVQEVKKLHRQGVSWKKLESFGLEYRYIALYLQGKLKYDDMVVQLDKAIVDFTKRQMTWFKRDKKIKWIKPLQAKQLVRKFLR